MHALYLCVVAMVLGLRSGGDANFGTTCSFFFHVVKGCVLPLMLWCIACNVEVMLAFVLGWLA